MKKLYYLIVLALILGLVLTGCFLSNIGQAPATEQSGITYLTKNGLLPVPLDEVNIGDTASETECNLAGWTNIWSGCGWCDPLPDGDGTMRLIWGDGGETCAPANNWASVDLDAGCMTALSLKVRNLAGAADDGFNVYVNGDLVGTFVDLYSSNTWLWTEFDISLGNYTGVLPIKFVATASAWPLCGTYGQVAFSVIKLYGGPVSATVDIDPNELNLDAHGKWITAYIELPEGYDVNDIDVLSVKLCDDGNLVPAKTKPTKVGDHDGDYVPDLMVKFDRADVALWFEPYGEKTLTLTGTVGGICFEGSDNITTITEDIDI